MRVKLFVKLKHARYRILFSECTVMHNDDSLEYHKY